MVRYTQHPDLDDGLARKFREGHVELFENGSFIATNNKQVVKSFELDGEEYVIKRYPENGPRANLRSILGISRAMNSFKRSAQLSSLGIQIPIHFFVARHLGFFQASSYLIMKKSRGVSLHSMLAQQSEVSITNRVIDNLVAMTQCMHAGGLSHGDLHAGNVFVLGDESVEFIDLDNVASDYKRQEKDIARLIRSFHARPALQEKLDCNLTFTS